LTISSLRQRATAKPGEWPIIENDAGRVLAQLDTDPADNRFPLAIYRPFSGRDAYVSIRFMTISGETDQAAGVFVRFTSVDDYYVARASASKITLAFIVSSPESER